MKNYVMHLTILLAAMSASTTYVSAEGETVDNSWQSPIVREFNQLDTTGNGLLLRNEASKNNAFTKKSFEEADINHDNAIDVDEYIYFKTGQFPTIEDKIQMDPNAVSMLIDGSERPYKKLYI